MIGDIIPQEKFNSPDVLSLAQFLLGKYLVSKADNKFCIGQIVETEAYKAPEDKACHAYNNKLTFRTKTMFEKGGIAYIYLCYGIHNMLNIVTAKKGTAHAILIRAIEPIEGIDIMRQRRQTENIQNIGNGPGKLCQALGIERKWDGLSVCSDQSPVYILANNEIPDTEIIKGPRVGVSYAEECAYWDWRFYIKDNSFVSKPKVVRYTH